LTHGENVNPCSRKKTKKEKKGEKEKIPNPRVGESKKKREERKFLIKDQKKTEEIYRKVFGSDNI